MDNVLIVVDDLEAVKAFFIELGLEIEGKQTVEGPLVGKLIGLGDVRATLAMLLTPDGQDIELDKFHTPDAIRFGPVYAPVNTLGIRRIMFAVEDIDAVVARMPTGPSSLAKCSAETHTGSPTSAGRRASLSRLPSSAAWGCPAYNTLRFTPASRSLTRPNIRKIYITFARTLLRSILIPQ